MALDVFRATDPFGRIAERGAESVESTLRDALDGHLDVDTRVHERIRSTRGLGTTRGPVEVEVDLDASDSATVVEVHADDEVGLLYRIAATFAELGLDVSVAKVATLGDRVVDVFYVRDREHKKLTGAGELERLRRALVERLSDAGGERPTTIA
jgi:[protein-PII] uridylyltransferase